VGDGSREKEGGGRENEKSFYRNIKRINDFLKSGLTAPTSGEKGEKVVVFFHEER